jgi:polar amino acid transport system permease protein/cystine transport system permease protein
VPPSTWVRALDLLPFLAKALFVGAVTTLEITAGALVVAIILGLIAAALRTFPARFGRAVGATYVEVFRSVPVLTQLFIIYFGLAQLGFRLEPLTAAIAGFGINGGAYLTEVFRAGIEAIPRGQTEAAASLGLSRLTILRLVIMPQAIRIVLPPLGNFAVGLLKDTALASAVAAPEITFRARSLVDQTYLSTQIYLLLALFYLAMSLPLSFAVRRMERRMGRRMAR